MKKNKIYDLLIVIFIYIGLSCFPVNLFGLPQFVEILIQILLQIIVFAFLLVFNKKSNNKIQIPKTDPVNTLLMLPVFILCFSNFFCLIVPDNYFEIAFSAELELSIVLSMTIALNEEIIFRSILLENFFKEKHPLLRILLSASIFAACHLTHFFSTFNPEGLVVVAYTFGIGIVLGIIYLYSGSFLMCCLFHFFFNTINNDIASNMLHLSGDASYYLINISVGFVVGLYVLAVYLLKFRKKNEN